MADSLLENWRIGELGLEPVQISVVKEEVGEFIRQARGIIRRRVFAESFGDGDFAGALAFEVSNK
jgi:hypothetical protein